MFVLLIGTLDTKGSEVAFVRDRLQAANVEVMVLDAGVLGTPAIEADIPRQEIFRAVRTTLTHVQTEADRGKAIALAAEGTKRIAVDLLVTGELAGVLGLGGSAGTTIATAAMRALPYGIPKLMISTLASGQVRPYVGERDIMMFHSVVDICGLNRFSQTILANAAAAMAGMVRERASIEAMAEASTKPVIAATMFGVTTPCVEACRLPLEQAGNEVLVFHATGTGGQALEALIHDDQINAVLDLTTTELADELVGGVLSAGPDRLTAAALKGIPQILSVGALDMVNFGPRDTIPARFAERKFYEHNPTVTLMRTTPEENDLLGKALAEKASAARGPTAILLPLKGVSALDQEGQPFWWPEADQALFQSLRNWISPDVRLVELDLHINDPAFAQVAVQNLEELIRSS